MTISDIKTKLLLILIATSYSQFSFAETISSDRLSTKDTLTSQESILDKNTLEQSTNYSFEKNSLLWSLMPGESVSRLSQLFYPNNQSMQQIFIEKTLYLSRNRQPNLLADSTSKQRILVVIPNIKQLAVRGVKLEATPNIKRVLTQQKKSRVDSAINQIVTAEVNTKIQLIYDQLVIKNEFLKQEINKINAKLAYLEQVFVALKSEVVRLADSGSLNAKSEINTIPVTSTGSNQQLLGSNEEQTSLIRNNFKQSTTPENTPSITPNSTVLKSAATSTPEAITKSMQVKPAVGSSYLLLSIFNFILVISCLIAFILFTRQQVKKRALAKTGKFEMTKSDEIRVKSLMIKTKLENQKKLKQTKINTTTVPGEFKHSMPGAEASVAGMQVVEMNSAEIETYAKPELALVVNAETKPETSPEIVQVVNNKQLRATEVKPKVMKVVSPNLESAEMAYDKDEAALLLGQAKIFVQANRAAYAIRLLKAQIQAAPKASLQHWLYLLNIYRETNQKEQFMQHATQLHQNFNVMMPLWENAPPKMIIASTLEEFSHISSKVTKLWADCEKETNSLVQTKTYLDELLTDNRDSQRTGFSMEVFEEIVLLRNLLDTRDQLIEEKAEAY